MRIWLGFMLQGVRPWGQRISHSQPTHVTDDIRKRWFQLYLVLMLRYHGISSFWKASFIGAGYLPCRNHHVFRGSGAPGAGKTCGDQVKMHGMHHEKWILWIPLILLGQPGWRTWDFEKQHDLLSRAHRAAKTQGEGFNTIEIRCYSCQNISAYGCQIECQIRLVNCQSVSKGMSDKFKICQLLESRKARQDSWFNAQLFMSAE